MLPDIENDIEHSLQINNFSLDWDINKWFLSWMSSYVCFETAGFRNALENALEHSLQINGFSPDWVLRCVLRSPDLVNALEHSLQINGFFSPEWVLRCALKLPDSENDLEHSLQVTYQSLSLSLIFLSGSLSSTSTSCKWKCIFSRPVMPATLWMVRI